MSEHSTHGRARWARLADTLASNGIDATVTERSYPGGISFFIYLPTTSGQRVVICDSWWREHWTGWQAWVEDTTTDLSSLLVTREKTRAGVARAVATAVTA